MELLFAESQQMPVFWVDACYFANSRFTAELRGETVSPRSPFSMESLPQIVARREMISRFPEPIIVVRAAPLAFGPDPDPCSLGNHVSRQLPFGRSVERG